MKESALILILLAAATHQAIISNSVLNELYSEGFLEDSLLNDVFLPSRKRPASTTKKSKKNHHTAGGSNDLGGDYVTCRDEAGQPIDWWVLYKLPIPHKAGKGYSDAVTNGTGYTYILSTNDRQPWTLSSKSMDDLDSLTGQTLAPVYKNNPNLMTFMYNDEKPEGPTSFDLGHTKGALFGDEYSGVWMIHSVPHFPPYPNQSYGFPHTGHRYGQTFLCITVRSEAMNDIGRQFLYNQPFMYGVQLPNWTSTYTDLRMAAQKQHIKAAPYYHLSQLKTLGGVKLTSFAKYKLYNKDLYSGLVAPGLKTSLLVETWPNGPGRMNSSCSPPYLVENIAEMDFMGINNEDFTTRHDHAKWAISLDPKRPFVCIGDINRMMTQLKRGGGTTCFSNLSVWRTFKSAVKSIETCPLRTKYKKYTKKKSNNKP
eukprot:TRINITY_DN11712_c1_g1_i2.p1 TRINITY_DN11712_c1_g1~~TRINITY_DN11712_c1_g1_i2.p1  ORF type:complete len:426 (-),score=78.58 TRINITY_DN11712_c1_g1_i2:166-1443(-)